MPPLTTTINGFQVQATPNAQPSVSQNTPTQVPAPQTIQPRVENVIPLQSIEAPRLNLPEQQPAGLPPLTNFADQILRQSQVQETDAQKAANTISERIFYALPQLTGQREALAQEQERAGVNRFRQELQDINSQILQKTAELNQDDIRLIQSTQEIEKQKIPIEFITGQQQSVQRDAQIARALKASEIGVLNARALATQGNIQLVMDVAQQAVDVKYAPLKETVEVYKAQLEALQPILSRDEKRQAREQEVRANLALREIERLQQNEKGVQDLIINAAAQNAPASILEKAKNAKTPLEASMALGIYSGDVLGRELKLSQIANSRAQLQETKMKMAQIAQQINQAQGELSIDRSQYEYGSKEYVVATILNSAKHDKALDQDQRNAITAATRALNSVDILTGVLTGKRKLSSDESKDLFGEGTGAVQGRLRSLSASLGGDADAAAVNAIITGLVPTVARGIFGEVGVLTDQDLANYRATVPNLNNPENVNKLVSLVLADTASKMIGGTLTTAANNRQNVSGFKDDYLNSLQKVESIKSNLGQIDSDTNSKLEQNFQNESAGQAKNSARGLIEGFFGAYTAPFRN